MLNARIMAVFITGLTVSAALILLVDRGGLIAWSASILGTALLVKIWLKPSKPDLKYGLALVITTTLAWFGTLYYVISTYESGEVVELVVDTEKGAHKVRLWVFDIGTEATVYYDAEPEVANALLSGTVVQLTRGGTVSSRIPRATEVDTLAEDKAQRVLEAMGKKYGDRMVAADVSYLLLGVSRDRVSVIVSFTEA